jgi:hypothetical protein
VSYPTDVSGVGSVAEAHPASYLAGTGDNLPEAKVAGLEGNHSPLSPLPEAPICTHKGTAKTVPKNSKHEKSRVGFATPSWKHARARSCTRTRAHTRARETKNV